MLEQLEQLANAVEAVSIADARRLAEEVNQKIVALVNAPVGKLYWRESPAEDGSILNPIAWVNKTQLENPRPFQVTEGTTGILPWVFRSRHSLWLEELRSKDLTAPVSNELGGPKVPPEHLDMRGLVEIDSMVTVPIRVSGHTLGVYSVELPQSGRFNASLITLIERLSRSVGLILWNAYSRAFNEEKTSRAITSFLNVVRTFPLQDLMIQEGERSGFIARRFEEAFSEVERLLTRALESKGIQAKHYRPTHGQPYVLDDIVQSINQSQFCVADITGLNPNVLVEVGMMIILRKNILLLRERGDDSPRPFDLNQFPCYDYRVEEGNRLLIWNEAEHRFEPVDDALEKFMQQIAQEHGSSSRRGW
ncbi:MAG TPA: GAF domain-containing protein [Acidimicrobiales bacterium]|nr:GAF domain-containing protein [Acidimicrobiales bacterium]